MSKLVKIVTNAIMSIALAVSLLFVLQTMYNTGEFKNTEFVSTVVPYVTTGLLLAMIINIGVEALKLLDVITKKISYPIISKWNTEEISYDLIILSVVSFILLVAALALLSTANTWVGALILAGAIVVISYPVLQRIKIHALG